MCISHIIWQTVPVATILFVKSAYGNHIYNGCALVCIYFLSLLNYQQNQKF